MNLPTNSPSLLPPRDEILQTMERIYRYRMTTTSGGNLSIRDPDGTIWITPARVDKGGLRRDDIVAVKPSGEILGNHKPSSEFPFHQAIYRARPDLNAIVHAHPVALVAFSICGQVPNTRIFHQSFFMSGKVGFAPYALPGSQQLGDNIAASFAQNCDSVVLENHGVVVGADTLDQAFQRFEAFEFTAKTILKASRTGNIRYLTDEQLNFANQRRIVSDHGDLGGVTTNEKELRAQLIQFLRRGCQQRLLISTEGSFSARLGSDEFLITPSQKDREMLRSIDLVRVRDGVHETGKSPSRACRLHAAIYAQHPEVQSIVFAHPVNATAFSITDMELDSRTIPESYIFLREVKKLPFGIQYASDASSLASQIDINQPAALLDNDGVVVLGRSILDAFDRLEVLETTAEAIINAQSLGKISTMSEQVIDELKTAFQLS
ncbi:MAG: class II aldolase/adducin family protein [Pirellula sp.]